MATDPAAKTVVDEKIATMARRIVERFDPEKIILFGSHARGEVTPDSDADLLVVMRFAGSRLDRTVEVRVALRGIGLAKDVFLVTPEEFEGDADVVGTLAWAALREGIVLYERRRARCGG